MGEDFRVHNVHKKLYISIGMKHLANICHLSWFCFLPRSVPFHFIPVHFWYEFLHVKTLLFISNPNRIWLTKLKMYMDIVHKLKELLQKEPPEELKYTPQRSSVGIHEPSLQETTMRWQLKLPAKGVLLPQFGSGLSILWLGSYAKGQGRKHRLNQFRIFKNQTGIPIASKMTIA